MSLFRWRRSQLFWRCFDDASRERNPINSSRRTPACSRSPSMTCSFPGDTTSLHHAPHCHHVTWKGGTTRGLLSSTLLAYSLSECSKIFVLSIVRTHAACPTNFSRSDPDCRSEGSQGLWNATEYQLHRRGILSTHTPSLVERLPGHPQA